MNPDTLFSYVAPVLLVLGIASVLVDKVAPWGRWGDPYKWLFAAGLSALTLIPIGGVSVAGLLLSLNPNYSIGLTMLLGVFLAERVFGVSLLSARDVWILCLWNVGLGFVLYAGFLGFMPYDVYPMGYDSSSGLFWITGAMSLGLVLAGSRLQWVFIGFIMAWDLGLLPSPNFFDYMIDLFLFLLCTGMVIRRMARRGLQTRGGARCNVPLQKA